MPDNIPAPSRHITFLGLGMMGLPMARNLLRAGHVVHGFDPNANALAELVAAGGLGFDSPAAAAKGCEILITMLPNGGIVRSALLDGQPHAASQLAGNAIVIDMSSSSPLDTQKLAQDLAPLGLRLIDAPVSGGVSRARDGSLSIMVGGDETSIAAVQPILAAMGTSIFPTGGIGTGHAMKALNNYVSAAGLVAACEAVHIGEKFGLDPNTMVDVLNASTGRNNSTQVKMKPFVITKSYASGFSLALMAKDLRIADDLARSLEVPAALSHLNADLWDAASKQLGKDADHTEIDRFLSLNQGN